MAFNSTIQDAARAVATRKRRWKTLLEPASRPGFCFLVNYNDPSLNLPPSPPHWPELSAERIERKWQDYERALDRMAWLDDDSIPCIDMLTGTEIFAEAFGCPVHRPDNNNPFALPLIHDAREVAALNVPDLSSSTLDYLFDMADELKRRAGPEAVFRLVDIQSPMDIAALIWEKSSFFIGLTESPEAVHELANKTRTLLFAFLDDWFSRYGTDFVAHFPPYFMTGGVTLSEDEVGAISGRMFEEFFLPELEALSARYGGIGIHCCADAKHQWKNFRRVKGLRLLNLCNPPTRAAETYIKEAYPSFGATCAQWHCGWTPDGPPETWPTQYPEGCRVVIELCANSREEAIRLCAQLQEARAQGISVVK